MARSSEPIVRSWETALVRPFSSALAVLVASLLILSSYSTAHAQAVSDEGYFRFATLAAVNQYVGGGFPCNEPTCTAYGDSVGGAVYTSDYEAAQSIYVYTPNFPNGGSITWVAVKPNETQISLGTLTWSATTGCWTWSGNGSECCSNVPVTWVVGPTITCQQAGPWGLQTWQDGTLLFSHTFSLEHGASGLLGITSPTDSQLVALDQQDYTPTSPVAFNAGSEAGGSINWNIQLHYLTSGGYGGPDPSPETPTTNSGSEYDHTFQSIGGQVNVTASTTNSYGTFTDCVSSTWMASNRRARSIQPVSF
jgi:hypothetical protein